ncbi:hypothetical protein LJK87_22950 [Paenibacillus sp. P25]|nr:hypothetical protein LJK87_22950 [Paenibacillus sp. P25]
MDLCRFAACPGAAVQGVLDLRGTAWDRPILLEGEWRFYPERFLMQPGGEAVPADGVSAAVPGSWKGLFADPKQVTGYGSYRLLIRLDDSMHDKSLALAVPPTMSASELYVNGIRLGERACRVRRRRIPLLAKHRIRSPSRRTGPRWS